MAKKKIRRANSKRSSSSRGAGKSKVLAIIAMILNVLIFPGLGTLIAGKIKVGIWQVLITVVGAIIWLVYGDIGAALIFASWIWSIVTGVQIIKESI
jgi:hypothetical protein